MLAESLRDGGLTVLRVCDSSQVAGAEPIIRFWRVLVVGLLALHFTVDFSPVYAQEIELGGTIGFGARGSESAAARLDKARSLVGAYGSIWWSDRFETAVRAAWFYEEDVTRGSRHSPNLAQGPLLVLETRHGVRRIVGVDARYYYRQEPLLRPYFGGGVAVIRDQLTSFCEFDGCDAVVPDVPLGPFTATDVELVFLGGLSKTLNDHLRFRVGFQWLRPLGESLSIFEGLVSLGYRFSR